MPNEDMIAVIQTTENARIIIILCCRGRIYGYNIHYVRWQRDGQATDGCSHRSAPQPPMATMIALLNDYLTNKDVV